MRSGGKRKRPLTPCTRPPWPALEAPYDLTYDHQAVKEILQAIQPFFRFRRVEARFSGFARRLRPDQDCHDPCFYVQVWNGDELYRTVGFLHLGYQGILHVDLIRPDRAQRALDDDPISIIWNGLDSWTNLDYPFLINQIWYVDGETLTVPIPWRKVKATRPRWVLDGQG